MSQNKRGFHSESARTQGETVTTTFTVTGGELDTTLLDQLTNVTLTRIKPGTYTLTTRGGTFHERTVRTASVYNALIQYYEGDRRPLDQLIENDATH